MNRLARNRAELKALLMKYPETLLMYFLASASDEEYQDRLVILGSRMTKNQAIVARIGLLIDMCHEHGLVDFDATR